MIEDINIRHYRIFDELSITDLARVNLIVGTNNSGKSSLLESIHLLSSEDVRNSLISILRERGEYAARFLDTRLNRTREEWLQIAQVFHGRSLFPGAKAEVRSQSAKADLVFRLDFKSEESAQDIYQRTLFDESSDEDSFENGDRELRLFLERSRSGHRNEKDALRVSEEGLIRATPRRFLRRLDSASQYITTSFLGYDDLALLWDSITLTPKEDRVVQALRILESEVERISFTSSQTPNSGILIKLKDQSEPVPLGSMGDGMRRVLAIIASLVSVDSGSLLVDEIDTGLYYAVLEDMWRLVILTAKKQDAQLFATTHSWDCVRAFQKALKAEDTRDVGRLIRLERKNDRVEATTYDADELHIAVNQGIEVR